MLRIGFIRRGVLDDSRTGVRGAGWAILAVVVPTAAKFALDAALSDVPPFLTYFPALTAAAMFLGARWGLAVLALSVAAANYFFMRPRFGWALSANDLILTLLFLAGGALIVATAAGLRGAAGAAAAATLRERALNSELQHRVKNNLAVVQGRARQTARSTPEPQAFYEAFHGRLMALGEAHEILSSGEWSAGHMPELVEAALRPFRAGGDIAISGPGCSLPAGSCVPLVLALHELGVNATKYGALSAPTGRVDVSWRLQGSRLHLQWREQSGPPVQPPTRRGLGSRLLTSQQGLDDVVLEFRREGVVCEIVVNGARSGEALRGTLQGEPAPVGAASAGRASAA
jgi:two-component sensor histidine kinase